jgi:hypothetical protein
MVIVYFCQVSLPSWWVTNIPDRTTFIALGALSNSQGHPLDLFFHSSKSHRSKPLFDICSFVSGREERIVCGSLADYLQPPQLAHFVSVMIPFSEYMPLPYKIRAPKSPAHVEKAESALKVPMIRLTRRTQSYCGEWHAKSIFQARI